MTRQLALLTGDDRSRIGRDRLELLSALIAAPGESTAESDFIARRFMEGTQAFHSDK